MRAVRAGADKAGAACDATFHEVPWSEEVFIRGRDRADTTGVGAPHAPSLVSGAIRASDPPDKADDLFNSKGQVRACVHGARWLLALPAEQMLPPKVRRRPSVHRLDGAVRSVLCQWRHKHAHA
jgi:hypothetical protein